MLSMKLIQHDYKRSIFIGNLPFDVTDDDVWNAFEQCGQIESTDFDDRYSFNSKIKIMNSFLFRCSIDT